jgi:uncharacterized protein DUF5677
MDDRLPEMLWAALVVASVDRDSALAYFRHILNFIRRHKRKSDLYDTTLSGIAKLDPPLRQEIVQAMVALPHSSDVLAPLLMFDALPAKDTWEECLPSGAVDAEPLMRAVGATLAHQSQEATDCRWIRMMSWICAGKLTFPHDSRTLVEDFSHYPNRGNQQTVQGLIRATEGSIVATQDPDLTWPRSFWDEAWEKTPCLVLFEPQDPTPVDAPLTRPQLTMVGTRLKEHWEATHTTTAIAPKHDGVFGMALYALRVLDEMLGIAIGTGVLARLGLRVITEVRLNLRYLLIEDDADLWKKWRDYGIGQAKLNSLRFDGGITPPEYMDLETIHQIANEDIWEEFRTINLASWSGSDLRKLSMKANLKDTYDRHYSWTSGYAHGMWGAVRETCYQTCGNPLHRLHRYPDERSLKDTVDEAASLVDDILEDLGKAFPPFPHRLLASLKSTGSDQSHCKAKPSAQAQTEDN